MTDVNLVMVAGRLIKDPELKYAENGIPVCRFSLATTRRFTKPDGSKGESTVFVDVSAWRRLAEICSQFLKKGRSVLVIGALQESRKPNGEAHQRPPIRIKADSIQFLGETKAPSLEAKV